MSLNEETMDDVVEAPGATLEQLSNVIKAAREQKRLENEVDRLDKELKQAKKDLQLHVTTTCPKALEAAGMLVVPLDNGWSVEVEKLVTASVPSPFAKKAENALERNRVGIAYCEQYCPDLVNRTVTIEYPKGAEKQVKKLLTNLDRYKVPIPYTVESTVHSGSLGAWVRAQDSLGKAVDEAALGVYRANVTVLVKPKKPKNTV